MKIFEKNKYKFLIFGIVFLFPAFSFASGLNYGNIISQGSDSFAMTYGNTESPDYYTCTISSMSCVDNGKNKPSLPVGGAATAAPHFSFFTKSVFKKNIHIRTFYLTNTLTKKTYTRSYTLGSWDTLGDEGTIYSFSPNGTRMVYQDDATGYPVLYSVNLTTLKGRIFRGTKVFTTPTTVNRFILTSQNDLYFISNKDSAYAWNLYKYNFTTKKSLLVAENASYAHVIRNFNSGLVFVAIQGASSFPEFYNESTNQVERFSGLPTDTSVSTINSQDISFGGGMHGVLMTPQNFDKTIPHQLVIWLHGGPYRQTSIGFQPYPGYAVYDLILNQLAQNNVMVLKLDYRGSYAYGASYAKSIIHNVGKGDVADIVNALSLIKKDFSVSNTYLMGNSYGGYLALRSIVENPNNFSGVISINGVTDWTSMLKAMKTSIFNVDFNGVPKSSNANLYAQASIFSRIGNLTTQKIVLMQSQSDTTVPPSQADNLYKALQNAGKNVQFIPYVGEDHTFTKTTDIENICQNVFGTLSMPLAANCNFQ